MIQLCGTPRSAQSHTGMGDTNSMESVVPWAVRYAPAAAVLLCGLAGRRRVSDACLLVLAALFGAMTVEVLWGIDDIGLRDLLLGAALAAVARLVAIPLARRYDRRHPSEPDAA